MSILIFFRSSPTFSFGRKSSQPPNPPHIRGIILSQHNELCKVLLIFGPKGTLKVHEDFSQWLSILIHQQLLSLGVVHSQSLPQPRSRPLTFFCLLRAPCGNHSSNFANWNSGHGTVKEPYFGLSSNSFDGSAAKETVRRLRPRSSSSLYVFWRELESSCHLDCFEKGCFQ